MLLLTLFNKEGTMDLKLSYNEAKHLTKVSLLAGRTPALWGPPGIGKSSLGREVANDMGAKLYILDAPLLQPIDYCVAVPNHTEKKVELYPSGFLPQEGPAVVLVEDLPHAREYQMIPIMQMVLDRRIGPMQFQKDVFFIITGNREEDLAGVNPLPSPLKNRLVHINMDAEPEEWVAWAKKTKIHPLVIGFIQAYPGKLLELPKEGKNAWPTPRSWHMASDLINVDAKTEKDMRYVMSSTVGDATAYIFMSWVKYFKDIAPASIIEKGNFPQISERAKLFAVVLSVSQHIKTKGEKYIRNNKEGIKSFFDWLQGEFKITFLKEIASESKNNTKLLEAIMEIDPSVSQYVLNLLN